LLGIAAARNESGVRFLLAGHDRLATAAEPAVVEIIARLSKSIRETDIEIQFGHFSTSIPAVKAAYRRAMNR
jgi:hypothetical protein